MHANIVNIVLIRSHICFSGKPAQTFPKYENAKRVDSSNKNIDSEVKFESIDEIGATEVPLYNAVLLRVYILQFSSEEYALSLR